VRRWINPDGPGRVITAQIETHLLELMDHIDATYRTKRPSRATVTP
jgi:hypothetical protein